LAEEALLLLEQVVGDVSPNMPGMNGLDLLKIVKEKHQHLRVFMITAYGCDDYFTKPLNFGMLKAKLLA
jgi:YesN/AraC family two-component response regulator